MDALAKDFHAALQNFNGHQLAATISPIAPPNYLNRIEAVYTSTNAHDVAEDLSYALTKNAHRSIGAAERRLLESWRDIYVAYWHATGAIVQIRSDYTAGAPAKSDWSTVYESWKTLANLVIKSYDQGNLENWTLPVMYMTGKYIRIFASKADEQREVSGASLNASSSLIGDDIASDSGSNAKLEDAGRVINRMFQKCISDRAPLEESRKWGVYYIANLLFKTHFKLNSISLSKNILRAISASQSDMPDLEAFPKSHIVTYRYYLGVINFLDENYAQAEDFLTAALNMTHHSCFRNKASILTYLIPTRLLNSRKLPSRKLLSPYPQLSALFTPLVTAIRSGALSAFDAAMTAGEADFVRRRIYLTLERGRDVCLRNLLRKVFLSSGTEEPGGIRRTRIKVEEFGVGIALAEGKDSIENDEVECLLANMIYKNLMKGYISRQAGTVVLSKTGAFPGTGI